MIQREAVRPPASPMELNQARSAISTVSRSELVWGRAKGIRGWRGFPTRSDCRLGTDACSLADSTLGYGYQGVRRFARKFLQTRISPICFF